MVNGCRSVRVRDCETQRLVTLLELVVPPVEIYMEHNDRSEGQSGQ